MSGTEQDPSSLDLPKEEEAMAVVDNGHGRPDTGEDGDVGSPGEWSNISDTDKVGPDASKSEDDENIAKRSLRHLNYDKIMLKNVANGDTLNSVVEAFQSLDETYKVPSPAQIVLAFKTNFDAHKFPTLKEIPKDTLHLTIQFWNFQSSSEPSRTLFGVHFQFINDDWKLESFQRGFEPVSEYRCYQNLETQYRLYNLLIKYGIGLHQIGVVLCDEAPIMDDVLLDDIDQLEFQRLTDQILFESGVDSPILDFDVEDGPEDPAPDGCPSDEPSPFNTVNLSDLCDPNIDNEYRRELQCTVAALSTPFADYFSGEGGGGKAMSKSLVHPLYTILRHCISTSDALKGCAVQMKTYFTFFLKSNGLSKELLKLTGGVKLFETRACLWKSFILGMHRLSQETFRNAVNQLLAKARKAKPDDKTVPKDVGSGSGAFLRGFQTFSALLKPIVDLLDTLRGDGITSSSVIPGIIKAYRDIAAVNTGEGLAQFQAQLCRKIKETFTENSNSWFNVLRNKHFILAAILDPRKKLLPKLGQFKEPDVLAIDFVFMKEALKTEYCKLLHNAEHAKAKEIFAVEWEKFSKMLCIPGTNDPFEFWKSNAEELPIFAKLARIYLGFPATSGPIDRTLAIGKTIVLSGMDEPLAYEMLEHILMYREFHPSH